ncbi:MAG: 16S rRNA (guanine(527)-N(7))-methyltransferase RsmG [Ruminococcus sp.]|nr:16S rRNA (guanine(527)-N(7))-methyltransferase RsmG [Ruminococcus sp.]
MKDLLKRKCDEIGVELTDFQCAQFERYYELLIDWNKKINLTRITEPDEVVIKHFVDSLTLLKYCEIPQNAKVIDVGTGAGFPGIPLKIARPDIELTLLDSLNKRLTFLKEVCGNIEISAELVHLRAEEGSRKPEYRDFFDVVVSRAVARLNTLSEYCLPYVKVGGSFIAMKGPELSAELNEAKSAIKTLGGKVESVEEFELCGSGRTIVTIIKEKQTPKAYPRHSSKIKAKPL